MLGAKWKEEARLVLPAILLETQPLVSDCRTPQKRTTGERFSQDVGVVRSLKKRAWTPFPTVRYIVRMDLPHLAPALHRGLYQTYLIGMVQEIDVTQRRSEVERGGHLSVLIHVPNSPDLYVTCMYEKTIVEEKHDQPKVRAMPIGSTGTTYRCYRDRCHFLACPILARKYSSEDVFRLRENPRQVEAQLPSTAAFKIEAR